MYLKSLLLILPLLALASSCGTSRAYDAGPSAALDANQSAPEPPDLLEDRKVLYSARLVIVVPQPDSAVVWAVQAAEAYGGFMTSTTNNSALIRVPAAAFELAMNELAEYGKLREKNISGRDVTDEYLDLGIRLENAEKSRSRYLELLARAETVEAALAVERELERLNEVIDRYKGQLNRIEQLEAYSTIQVYFQQKAKLGPLGAIFKGLYAGVEWLFVRK